MQSIARPTLQVAALPRQVLQSSLGENMTSHKSGLLIVILAIASPREAFALITGGAGNKPVSDPGWPKGAAGIF
jgi:hypothetical protein